jgi:hypothetical protein
VSQTQAPAPLARRLWVLLEPLHAVTYFAPEARAAFEAAGLRGFWRGYFAGRAAPLGGVEAAPVTALFNVFALAMVARALPDVWSRATPEAALGARVEGATAALRRVVGPDVPAAPLAGLEGAVGSLDCSGRALGAANQVLLGRYDDPLARLWQSATTVREHRGDGHAAALGAAGVDGCAALVWRAAVDGSADVLRGNRGWTDEEWASAADRLRDRGWLDATGTVTTPGRAAHADVEARTDADAGQVWEALDADDVERLVRAIAPLSLAVLASLPQPNPIGLPTPEQVAVWLQA